MASITESSIYDKSSYIPAIDGLRAFAVIAVVIFHLKASFLPGGFTGVDIFFVISGFVVTASLVRHRNDGLWKFITGFYARRILRIFPALVLCLLLTTAAVILFVPESWHTQTTGKTGVLAFFGLGNLALFWHSHGYFALSTEFNAFTHTWSLGIEEQFYFIFPPIVYFWLKTRNANQKLKQIGSYTLLGLFLLSIALSTFRSATYPKAAFYLLENRFWELAAGALLYQLWTGSNLFIFQPQWRNRVVWTGAALLLAGVAIGNHGHHPSPMGLLPVAGTFLLIAGIICHSEEKNLITRALASRSMIWVGKRSYSIYLWHWPVFVLLRWTAGLESAPTMLIALVLSVALGDLSYRFVETPVRKHRFGRLLPEWGIVVTGIAAISACAFVAHKGFKDKSHYTLSRTRDKEAWYPAEWKDPNAISSGRLEGRQLFVFGDSHGVTFRTAVQALADQHGIKVVMIVEGGRPVAKLMYPVGKNGELSPWFQQGYEQIKANARPGDIVYLPSLRVRRFTGDLTTHETELDPAQIVKNHELGYAEAVKELELLAALPVHLIIDAPKPVYRSPAFRCVDWFNKMNPIAEGGLTMEREELLQHRQLVMEKMEMLQAEFPELVVWDPFFTLCPDETCHAMDGELPLFFDGDHLSAHGNRVLYPEFEKLILRMAEGDEPSLKLPAGSPHASLSTPDAPPSGRPTR
ncbi:MAG: acyltransferase family protein [Verrucomicrobiota bacterium JB022]|nr:acyltransferase family protein [Verrucomicrobiota bacterium JB022]